MNVDDSDRTPAGTTMRAAVLYGAGDLRIEDRPRPSPRPGEVLLEVGTVGLCGTDASEYTNGPRMFPVHERHPVSGHQGPMIIGHEFAGRVVALGPDVGPEWLGRDVASCGAISCTGCWQCQRGRPNLCTSYVAVGLHRDGALAEYVTTPLQNCSPVDTLGMPPDAAALGQPMSIAVHACSRARVQDGERVLIFGVGGIGAFLVYAVSAAGGRVIAVDASADRLALAARLGALATFAAQTANAEALVSALDGPPEVVFEASGRPEALALALRVLPPGGRLVPVGLQSHAVELDLRQLTLSELELIGTMAMVREHDFDRALKLVAGRRAGWGDVAPTVVPLEELAAGGLKTIADGKAEAVKLLVDPRTTTSRPSRTRTTEPTAV